MLLGLRLHPYRIAVLLGVLLLITVAFYGFSGRSAIPFLGGGQSRPAGVPDVTDQKGSTSDKLENDPSAWPLEYGETSSQTSFCEERFGFQYLSDFSQRSAAYCTPESATQMTCFSSTTEIKSRRKDAFCIAGPATFDTHQHKFILDCSLRDLTADESSAGLPRFSNLPAYWYSTGPKYIFSNFVQLGSLLGISAPPSSSSSDAPLTILVKREDEYKNTWHAMMEIFATFMTLDILRMAHNPDTKVPYFQPSDFANTQVLFLDTLPDGPYPELWHLFARRPILRLSDITDSSPLLHGSVIVPLAGGGNPFWQGDWDVLDCTDSTLLRTFSRRVLNHYKIPTPPKRATDQIVVTYIDRTTKRRLIDQVKLLDALRSRHPNVRLNVLDFAQMPFAEQLAVDQSTDILVGVHGAGLTHGMFLRRGSAIVEILPPGLKHKGFLNMAAMLGHAHFSAEAIDDRSGPGVSGDWQADDVQISQDAFLNMLDQAIKRKMGS